MFKTVVVALDNTELADQVVATLESVKLAPDHQIVFVHVLPTVEEWTANASDRPQESWHTLYQTSHQNLQYYRSFFPQSQMELPTGDTATEIIRLLHIHQAELIILGSRGYRGMKKIIVGSVSSGVLEEAPCSVLIVK